MAVKERLQEILDLRGPGKQGLEEGAEALANAIAEALQVRPDEVGILLITSTQETLKFIWPRALYQSHSAFPVSHKYAFA